MKQPVLPLEGDLLFEEKPIPKLFLLFILVVGGYFLQAAIASALNFIQKPDILLGLVTLVFLVPVIFCFYSIFELLNEIRKYGLNDKTYKGYYFKDKIIFYRISKYVDEIYTKGLSKEEITNKIKETKVDIESMEKLLAETENEFSIVIAMKKYDLEKLEKGLSLIEVGLGKPHKIEVLFSEIKYFINEENTIKLVEKVDVDEKLNKFYTNIKLSKKYKKYQSDIVEFLNQRVSESAVFEDGDNVN